MSGSIQYRQKCVCGAEIAVAENFSFVASARTPKHFEAWQREHRGCLVLFRKIQNIRIGRLTGNKQELITSEVMK